MAPTFEMAAVSSRMIFDAMPRADYLRCRNCNGEAGEVGPLSHTRLCAECGVAIEAANALQIHAGVGPYADRRRYGIALAEFGPRVALALKQAGVFDSASMEHSEPAT